MPSRRQERVARIIKESVSDSIANHLSDPRVSGLISITEVDISPNLRKADIYISIMAKDQKCQNRTFAAIEHAAKHIQTRLGHKMTSKFCPHLEFHQDKQFKKTIEIMNLIDEAAKEFREEEQTEENC